MQAIKISMFVSQKKSANRIFCICYLKVTEGQVSLSTLFGTLRACVNSSSFGYFGGLEEYTFQEL